MSKFKVGDVVYISDCNMDIKSIVLDLGFAGEKSALKYINKKAKIIRICNEASVFDYHVAILDNDKFPGLDICLMKNYYIKKINQKSKIIRKI